MTPKDEHVAFENAGVTPTSSNPRPSQVRTILALSGPRQAGKSTTAKYLEANHGYVRVGFADPIRVTARCLGIPEENITGSKRDEPLDVLGGHSCRKFMELFGTEFGRDMISPDLWTDIACQRIEQQLQNGYSVVVDDMRFPNELARLRAMHNSNVRVLSARIWSEAASEQESTGHISDKVWLSLDFDTVLINNKTLEDLHGLIDETLGL